MNAKQIIATHRAWRLFNRKGRVTATRLVKAVGRGTSPTAVVKDVRHAYGVNIRDVGDGVFELQQTRTGRPKSKTATTAAPTS